MALGGLLVFMGVLVSQPLSRDVTAQEETFGKFKVGVDPPADISVSEYLQLFFATGLGQSSVMQNNIGFHMIKPQVLFTHPRAGRVQDGLVYVTCVWGDDPRVFDLQGTIRDTADGLLRQYALLLQWCSVRERWVPSKPLVIRHVREKTWSETLGVTYYGETYFDPTLFDKAEQLVQNAGGDWDFLR